MEILVATNNQLHPYTDLFYKTFAHNKNLSRIDFYKKITSGGHLKPVIIFAVDKNIIIGALTMYPAFFNKGGVQILAAQIGDALVIPEQRGKGVLKKIVKRAQEIGKNENFEFLFTFPSTNNQGSLKSFLANNWINCHSLINHSIRTNPSIIGRIIRKISTYSYLKYEVWLTKNTVSQFTPKWKSKGYFSVTDKSFYKFKSYMTNTILCFKSGMCYISLTNFSIILSYYEVKESFTYMELLMELIQLANKLAKESIEIIYSPSYNLDLKPLGLEFNTNTNLQALVLPLTEKLNPSKINFVASDIDTF